VWGATGAAAGWDNAGMQTSRIVKKETRGYYRRLRYLLYLFTQFDAKSKIVAT